MDRDGAYLGWLRDVDERQPLVDDRSESFASLDRRYGRSGKGRLSAGAISLRNWMPPIRDQGALQSCTAHAAAAAMGFVHDGLQVSRLQLYYLSRAYQHDMHRDAGARLHNAIRALREHGAAFERDWPYDPAKVTDRPGRVPATTAEHHKISRYAPLAGGAEFRLCLEHGYPFVIGMHHTDAFWSDTSAVTGVIPLPAADQPTPHAHAVCVIGYADPCARAHDYRQKGGDDGEGLYYEVRNSAGPDWGDEGHFWVPAAYLENPVLAGDAWTIRR